jgi:lysophospholipase L1-like esterase
MILVACLASRKHKPQPITADEADVAVIYIGLNDVWWRKTTPEVFERGLREIVDQAKANKTIPVLATLAVMKEAIGSRNPKCDAFADITRKVARDTGATLVDLRAAFMACLENKSIVIRPGGSWTSDGNLLTHDGVHMNGRGNEIVANLIANGIYEALRKN